MNQLPWQHIRSKLMLLLIAPMASLSVCNGENFREFRNTALPGVESGVLALLEADESALETIVDSLLMGVFEILEPDGNTSDG